MRATIATAVIVLAASLCTTDHAWAWGEARVARGQGRIDRGHEQLSSAKVQRSRVGKNLRRGVGYGLQVPGAKIAPGEGNAKRMARKSGRGFKAFAGNLVHSMGNSLKGRTNLAVGHTQKAIGRTQEGIAAAGSALWNSAPVSYVRLMGTAAGIAAGKAARAVRSVGGAFKTDNLKSYVTNNAGDKAVPSRYNSAAPIPPSQQLELPLLTGPSK